MIDASEVRSISLRINRMLPDDGKEALTVMALSFANVAVAAQCDDESAVQAVRIALKQMRKGDWWKEN